MWWLLFSACLSDPVAPPVYGGARTSPGVVTVKESGSGTTPPTESLPTESPPAESLAYESVAYESLYFESGWEDSGGVRIGTTAAERAGELGGSPCGDKSALLGFLALGAGIASWRRPRA